VQAPYSNGTHTETLEIGNSEYSNDSKGHAAFSVATFPNVVSKHQNPLKLTWGALRERFTTHALRTNKDGELFAPVTFKPGTRRKKENVGAIHLFVPDFDNGFAPDDFCNAWCECGLTFVV